MNYSIQICKTVKKHEGQSYNLPIKHDYEFDHTGMETVCVMSNKNNRVTVLIIDSSFFSYLGGTSGNILLVISF